VRLPDGGFGGIIVLSLDPNFVEKFYQAVDLGSGGTLIIRNLDGVTLAARGISGAMLAPLGPGAALPGAVARAPAGHFWGDGSRDGVKRLVAYRMSKQFPLIMTVARADSDILKAYRRNRVLYFAVAMIITLLVLIAIAVGARHQMRLADVRNTLRLSEASARERALKFEVKSHELELTLDYMGQGIIMTDAGLNVAVINRQTIELLELDESFHIDRPDSEETLSRLLEADEHSIGTDPLEHCSRGIQYLGSTSGDIRINQRKLSSGIILEIRTAALQGGGSVRTITDITARQRAEQEIAHLAHHDILTGLANRLMLHGRIDDAFTRARRCQQSFAILYLDLDRFKFANDRLGHQAGDVLLQQVAERLRQCVREVDTVARVGGDEFVVLQANIARASDVTPLAMRILETVSAPYDVNGSPATIGVSVGIAVAPTDGETTDDILAHADLALYRAKGRGRNAFCFFDREMQQLTLRRDMLERELREALLNNEFEVWYQPWFNIIESRAVGCEALLRWRHPRHGIVGPAEFIFIAEESGLIGRLGEWVLRRACEDACGWPKLVKLAVNLSPAQFVGGNLLETVCKAVAESGFEANRLELEITETVLIDDYERTRVTLSQFRGLDIGIALDDFGTGFSSLTHLRKLPFNRIKIDKSFVSEITHRTDSAAIVSAMIALGRSLGVSITAEGVETNDQMVILQAAGCTEAQGYLFSKPKPATEILKVLSEHTTSEIIAA